MKKTMKVTKTKKCDYCDDFAKVKSLQDGLYQYLCPWCYKHIEQAKMNLNLVH